MCARDAPANDGDVLSNRDYRVSLLLLAWDTCTRTHDQDPEVYAELSRFLALKLRALPFDFAVTLLSVVHISLRNISEKTNCLPMVAEYCVDAGLKQPEAIAPGFKFATYFVSDSTLDLMRSFLVHPDASQFVRHAIIRKHALISCWLLQKVGSSILGFVRSSFAPTCRFLLEMDAMVHL